MLESVFLGFVTWPHCNEMCEVKKGAWPSDIAKEMFDANLKLCNYHYVIKYLDGMPRF